MSPFHPYVERQLEIMSTLIKSIYMLGILRNQNAQLNKSMLKIDVISMKCTNQVNMKGILLVIIFLEGHYLSQESYLQGLEEVALVL